MSESSGHVLIVEDQENWRLALKVLLEGEGIRVTVTRDSITAKIALTKYAFAVAILDVRLIDEDILNIDGLELLQHIREHYPKTRVIVLTGYPENLEPDADAIILKAPEGSTFDSAGFKKQVVKLTMKNLEGI